MEIQEVKIYSFDIKWVKYFNKVRTLFWGGGVGGSLSRDSGSTLKDLV